MPLCAQDCQICSRRINILFELNDKWVCSTCFRENSQGYK